jgi:hypothetical protein
LIFPVKISKSLTMDSKTDRELSKRATVKPPPKKRFRIVKLEERIAPGKGGNGTNNCGGGGGGGGNSGASSGWSGGVSIY